MEIRPVFFDKNQTGGLAGKVYSAICAFFRQILSSLSSSRKAPDDFASRPEIPAPEEYEAASNTQILDRLYRNPCGLLNEQPYLDTLMNARIAESQRRQTRYLVLGFYVLAFSAIVLALNLPRPAEPPPPGQTEAQARETEKALGLLKDEFNLKLQGKELEIKELKRQLTLLNQEQAELTRQLKSLAKTGKTSAPSPTAATGKPKKAKQLP